MNEMNSDDACLVESELENSWNSAIYILELPIQFSNVSWLIKYEIMKEKHALKNCL